MDDCIPPEGEELFTNNCGLPIQFSMQICPEKEEYRRKIEAHGGCLTSMTGGHHTIRLIPPTLKTTSSVFDVFSTRYIDDCINGEKLLSLQSYRIGQSHYASDICVNDIMMGLKSWKDCTTARNEEGDDVMFGDDDDLLPLPPKQKWKGRREYEHRERRAILNFIIDNKKFDEVKGRNMWVEMEKAKVCPGRTWESMKEHFRKNIMNNLHLYKIDEKTQRRLNAPFVKGLVSSKRRYSSSDDSEEDDIILNSQENKSNLDKDKRVKRSDKINAKDPKKPADKGSIEKDNSNGFGIQEKSREQVAKQNVINEVEIFSQEPKEKDKGDESENYYSSDTTVMLDEELQRNEGKLEGRSTDDKDIPQKAVNSSVVQESFECDKNSHPSKNNFISSKSNLLPDVISSNSASINTKSNGIDFSNSVIEADSAHSNTQAFDVVYSNEQFNQKHDLLRLETKNKYMVQLPAHNSPEKNKVPLRSSESSYVKNTRSPSKKKVNAGYSLRTRVQTKTQVSENSVTADEVVIDPLKKNETHIETNGPKAFQANDENLSSVSNVGKQISSTNKKNVTSPRSVRTRGILASGQMTRKDSSDVLGSHLSGKYIEIDESCQNNVENQDQNKDTIQRETQDSGSENVDLNNSISSDQSTIIYPLTVKDKMVQGENSKTNVDVNDSTNNGNVNHCHIKEKRRKLLESDSDSEDQCDSSDSEIILRRKTSFRISGNTQKIQEGIYSELESKYVSDHDSSDEEDLYDPNRNNLNGRYDRTFNPKAGCREGDKMKNGKGSRTSTRARKPYTITEDVRILSYIIMHKGYDQLGGNVFWQGMEDSGTIPGRTWHGLRERYLKRIVHHLPTYVEYGIAKNHIRRLSSGTEEIKGPENQSPKGTSNRKKAYTREEDYAILNFINENKRHSQIGGKSMWVLMSECVDSLKGRTWLSLKERFRRVIMKNISTYKISEENLKKLKKSEKRRGTGIRMYFKEEKKKISDEDCDSSASDCSENLNVSADKAKTRDNVDRGLKSRSIIEKHLGKEPKPSTSNYFKETTNSKHETEDTNRKSLTKLNILRKRRLYGGNSLLVPSLEMRCRHNQSSTHKGKSDEECIQASTSGDYSSLSNPSISGNESEEIPLMKINQASNLKEVSSNLLVNNANQESESVVVNESSNLVKEKEISSNKIETSPLDSISDLERSWDSSDNEKKCNPTVPSCSRTNIDTAKSSQHADSLLENGMEENNLETSSGKSSQDKDASLIRSVSYKDKKAQWKGLDIKLRSSSARRKLRKRRVHQLKV